MTECRHGFFSSKMIQFNSSQAFKNKHQFLNSSNSSFLKTFLVVSLAPFSQTVGSLLIPLASKAGLENDLSIAPVDLTNTKFCPTCTLPLSTGSKISLSHTDGLGYDAEDIIILEHLCHFLVPNKQIQINR